jgi:hypothetical protein
MEIIANFPWYDMDRIEHGASSDHSIAVCVFVVAVMFLPNRFLAMIVGFLLSHCLATIGGHA